MKGLWQILSGQIQTLDERNSQFRPEAPGTHLEVWWWRNSYTKTGWITFFERTSSVWRDSRSCLMTSSRQFGPHPITVIDAGTWPRSWRLVSMASDISMSLRQHRRMSGRRPQRFNARPCLRTGSRRAYSVVLAATDPCPLRHLQEAETGMEYQVS